VLHQLWAMVDCFFLTLFPAELDVRLVSPTSPVRPCVLRFSPSKRLISKDRRGPKHRKSAVVPTKSILNAANMAIIGGHHVLALQGSPEGWQATSLLERCREHAGRRRTRGAAAMLYLGEINDSQELAWRRWHRLLPLPTCHVAGKPSTCHCSIPPRRTETSDRPAFCNCSAAMDDRRSVLQTTTTGRFS